MTLPLAELGKLFSRGMEDNMERAAFKLIPGVCA